MYSATWRYCEVCCPYARPLSRQGFPEQAGCTHSTGSQRMDNKWLMHHHTSRDAGSLPHTCACHSKQTCACNDGCAPLRTTKRCKALAAPPPPPPGGDHVRVHQVAVKEARPRPRPSPASPLAQSPRARAARTEGVQDGHVGSLAAPSPAQNTELLDVDDTGAASAVHPGLEVRVLATYASECMGLLSHTLLLQAPAVAMQHTLLVSTACRGCLLTGPASGWWRLWDGP